MGTQLPSPNPIFGPCLLWPNGWMDQDGTWHRGGPQPRRHCVTLGPSSPLIKGQSPQFSAHIYCGQMAVCTRIPLGTEVGLSLGDIVLNGDPAPPRKKGTGPHPIFGPYLLWSNGWIDQDATWYRGKPRPRQRCVDGIAAPISPKRGTAPNFWPVYIVAKRLDG